ncbi:hypothetical protein BU25DRAFT_423224 [Macroventuria anomochaeta]|uniref:Uncharacterized protein n=1 Tax=Macroventuria anomochaeta TaxID=301207 RepID=A0ACB6RW94_9PLEO|nr:uncharacterized protein BU25DRAFT_423224 [Macroventuria anomochaeta]KAF2625527.1 hypothetical protein BU25DRAFT_423224 [Macroventuria anomochaeta]
MSDSYTRKKQSTPPSRNFSHPNRHRAPNLSPSQYQNSHNQNRPPMAPDSRHMLPLIPGAIFTRSTSNLSLHSERHPHDDINFSYISPRRLGTSHTAFSSYSTPDLTLTALPQLPPVPPIPQPFGGPPPATINPPSPRRLVRSPPRSPTKSAKSTKGSGWRRLGRKVKKVFSFGRQKKRNSTHSDGGQRAMVIGEPYDFVHRETHGVGPLRPSGPARVGTRTTTSGVAGGESWSESMSGRLGCGLDDRPSIGCDGGVGARDKDISGGAEFGGLGNLDVEGTAVSDDEDSTWEDCEATRLFIAHQESLGRRT